MEFENLSLWSPEAGNPDADFEPFGGHSAPLFSPLQIEYGSFLEAYEAGVGDAAPPAPEGMGNVLGENEEEVGLEEGNLINAGCKNLLSERNRRRRLNQQLLALRSLVPCISKMDKRSVLMDAAAYLQSLHKEIDQLKRKLSAEEANENSPASSESIVLSPEETQSPQEASSQEHLIFQLDTEELDDRIFSLKVAYKKSPGATAQTLRMIESLGLPITHAWTHETEAQRFLTTCFIHTKKHANVTAEMLKVQASKAAVSFGFEIDFGD